MVCLPSKLKPYNQNKTQIYFPINNTSISTMQKFIAKAFLSMVL